MPLTTRHAFPSPASSAVPDVPVDMKALADAIDAQTAWVSTTEPPKVNGLIWRNPTTGLTQITDGTSWFNTAAVTWTTYTPTIQMANAAGTPTGRYVVMGKYVTVNVLHVAGAAASLGGGTIKFSLPFAALTSAGRIWNGVGTWVSGGAFRSVDCLVASGESDSTIFARRPSDMVMRNPGLESYTWTPGDSFAMSLTYERS